MHTRFSSAIFGMGIGLALAIPPAHAADEIEAKAQLCAACHGDKGTPADPKTIPVIWGQEQSYLMKQMRDFRNGERASAIMSPIAKAKLLYDFLDSSAFFKNPVRKSDRSRMNIPFTLADSKLDSEFLKGAEARGMVQLKGHRAVGGMRASVYNAMPVEGVKRLVEYMKEFEAKRG